MTGQQQLDIKAVLDEVLHEINSDWSAIDDKCGMLAVIEMHESHFTLRDVHNKEFQKDWDVPGNNTLYVQADFKQHDTVPVGPDE
eukprot:11804186-Karenia_brevis.AAC.1